MTAQETVVYQQPTCTTCREVHAALQEAGVNFKLVNYYLEPIPRAKLRDLLAKMGLAASNLLRKNEPIYKELRLDQRMPQEEELA